MDFQEVGWEPSTGFFWLRIGAAGGLLRILKWTLGVPWNKGNFLMGSWGGRILVHAVSELFHNFSRSPVRETLVTSQVWGDVCSIRTVIWPSIVERSVPTWRSVSVRVWVCVYVSVWVYMWVCVYVSVYVCECVYVWVCVCVWVCVFKLCWVWRVRIRECAACTPKQRWDFEISQMGEI